MEDEKTYFIVNPAGAIHQVNREHAKMRLKQPGFRMARPDEIVRLKAAKGNQTWDHPIAKKFTAEPDEQVILPDEEQPKVAKPDKLTIDQGEKLE